MSGFWEATLDMARPTGQFFTTCFSFTGSTWPEELHLQAGIEDWKIENFHPILRGSGPWQVLILTAIAVELWEMEHQGNELRIRVIQLIQGAILWHWQHVDSMVSH